MSCQNLTDKSELSKKITQSKFDSYDDYKEVSKSAAVLVQQLTDRSETENPNER